MKDERIWLKFDELREQLLEARGEVERLTIERVLMLAEIERLKRIIAAERGRKYLETQGVYQ